MNALRYAGLLAQTNLKAALSLRAATLLQVGFMFMSNLIYFSVWQIFFRRFHDLGGFGLHDMQLTYGVVAGGFGIAGALAGGLRGLSPRTARGARRGDHTH